MDYSTKTCSVHNTVIDKTKVIKITDSGFRLPGDNIILVNDELISKWREELTCLKL